MGTVIYYSAFYALWGSGNLGACISLTLLWFPGQQDRFLSKTKNRCLRPRVASPSFPGSWACTRGLFQFLRKLIAMKAWVGNYILFIHPRQGWGAVLWKSPQTATMLCQCLLLHHFAESSVWLPSPHMVSHGDNEREKGGVRRAGWELHSGKPSFESTFFSKPQTWLPK